METWTKARSVGLVAAVAVTGLLAAAPAPAATAGCRVDYRVTTQ